MLDTVDGLPLHSLVVHRVVVLLPVATLSTILTAVVPRGRSRYGLLVVPIALVATVLVPIATSSGESLVQRVGDRDEHAGLSEQLRWSALALVAARGVRVYRVGDSGARAACGDTPAACGGG